MKVAFRMVAITMFAFLLQGKAQAQGKYFGVYFTKQKIKNVFGRKQDFVNAYVGLVATPQTTKTGNIVLEYPGKTKKQLHDAVVKYVHSYSGFVLKDDDSIAHLHYRNFAYIGTKDKCMADLLAITVWGVATGDGALHIGWSRNDMYSTIYGAKLQVTKFDEVISENDVPFNQYLIAQPLEKLQIGAYRGVFTKTADLKLAYPESVFDPEGNVINPANKKIIEDFYDGFITNLKNYLDKNL